VLQEHLCVVFSYSHINVSKESSAVPGQHNYGRKIYSTVFSMVYYEKEFEISKISSCRDLDCLGCVYKYRASLKLN